MILLFNDKSSLEMSKTTRSYRFVVRTPSDQCSPRTKRSGSGPRSELLFAKRLQYDEYRRRQHAHSERSAHFANRESLCLSVVEPLVSERAHLAQRVPASCGFTFQTFKRFKKCHFGCLVDSVGAAPRQDSYPCCVIKSSGSAVIPNHISKREGETKEEHHPALSPDENTR